MTTEKSERSQVEKKEHVPFEQDPPIVVGGGNSAYVWIKRSLATLVKNPTTIPSTVPHPADPSSFIVYRVNVDIHVAVVQKGDGSVAAAHTNMNSKTHSTIFDS